MQKDRLTFLQFHFNLISRQTTIADGILSSILIENMGQYDREFVFVHRLMHG